MFIFISVCIHICTCVYIGVQRPRVEYQQSSSALLNSMPSRWAQKLTCITDICQLRYWVRTQFLRHAHFPEQSLQPINRQWPSVGMPRDTYMGAFLVLSQKKRGKRTKSKNSSTLSLPYTYLGFSFYEKSGGASWCACVISAPRIWRQEDEECKATLPNTVGLTPLLICMRASLKNL